jgi:hypothetical protein
MPMTLDETLLQRLAEWRPTGEERSVLTIPDQGTGWTATLTADRCDDLGCRLWEVQLRRTREAGPGVTLLSWANRVAEEVTGLLEPLRVVEIDTQRNEAQLRSDEPTQRRDKLFYYEVLLRGTREAVLRRYNMAASSSRREQVTFTLTHEVLAGFITDVAR